MVLPFENGLLFVHVPKTAGTSFREALKCSLGNRNMYFDYGTEAVNSTDLILKYLYPEERKYEFSQALAKESRYFCLGGLPVLPKNRPFGKHYFCLAGHFSLAKYAPLFLMQNTIVFLRDPVQRFVSDYEHRRRFKKLDMSLEAFCAEQKSLNVQSRILAGFSLDGIGFIGLQERYSESVQMFQVAYGVKLREFESNVFDGKVGSKYEIDAELVDRVRQANKQEIHIYQRAQTIFAQRWALHQKGLPYTHGVVSQLSSAKVSGWAVGNTLDSVVEVAIIRNGIEVGAVLAQNYRAALQEKNLARHGYIGFDFKFNKVLTKDDAVCCKVASTGQVLSGPCQIAQG